jgi:hypothetical protein
MVYRSKKDWWLVGLVWGGVSLPLLVGLYNVLAPGGDPRLGWELVRAGAAAAAAVVLLTYPLDYEITATHLVARSGVMRWRITLGSIESVRPSRSKASAPAWSLDRLAVEYLKDGRPRTLHVSPADKSGLLRELADAAPGLELRGDGVVRVS